MVLKSEQDRVKALLTEAITVLCKNGLGYKYTCCIQGLLGITLDEEDVFLVDLKETITKAKRPEPEQETNNQTSSEALSSARVSSPGGSNSRRRRRSGGSNGGTPAKRAARNEEPPSPDDVIVVKEESSESEMVQYFGSSGVGDDQLAQQDSYGMILQDSATFDGAGCSVWDSSSAQQAWPQQKMSEYESTQPPFPATSVCHLSPSQIVPSTAILGFPPSNLRSVSARAIFTKALVEPVLHKGLRVSAFGMCWPRLSGENLQHAWDNIISYRQELDRLAALIPTSGLFISAISASKTKEKNVQSKDYKIIPTVFYWMVMTGKMDDCKNLSMHMHGNNIGAHVKLKLQPFQQTQEEVCNALCLAVKDNTDGCVRQLINRGATKIAGPNVPIDIEPIVKIYIQDEQWRAVVEHLERELEKIGFLVSVFR